MSSDPEMRFCIEQSPYGSVINFISKYTRKDSVMKFQEIRDEIESMKLREENELEQLGTNLKRQARKRKVKPDKLKSKGGQELAVLYQAPVSLKSHGNKRKKRQHSNANRSIANGRVTRSSHRISILSNCETLMKNSTLARSVKKTGKFKMPPLNKKSEYNGSFSIFPVGTDVATTSKPNASTPVSANAHGFISPIAHHCSPTHACEKSPNVKNLIEFHEHVIHSSEPENKSANKSGEVAMETSHDMNDVKMVAVNQNEMDDKEIAHHKTPKHTKKDPFNAVRRSLHNELLASDIAEEIGKEPEGKSSLARINENSSQEIIENAIRNSWDEEEKEKLNKIRVCNTLIKLETLPENQPQENTRDSAVTSSSVCSSSANTIDINDITDRTIKDEGEDCELKLTISDSESETEVEMEGPRRQSRNIIRRSPIRVICGKTLSANATCSQRKSVRLSNALKRSAVVMKTTASVNKENLNDSLNDSENTDNPNSQWQDTEVEPPRPKIAKPVIKPKPKIKKTLPKQNAMSCGGVKRSRNVFTLKNASFGGDTPKQKRFNAITPQHNSVKTFFGTSEKARVGNKVNSFLSRGNSNRYRTPGVSPYMGRTRPFSPFGSTPSSSSNINSFVGSFLTRTTPQKINKEAELEAKKLHLEEKEKKDEEIKRRREEERNERIAESKRKRETRAQKANLLREEREKKEKERQDLLQSQKDKRHMEAENIKNQKKAEELAKIQKEKEKQASAEARRKDEMEEKNRKIREQEAERLRKIENRQLQKKLAEEQKAFERRQEEERREQKRLEEERLEEERRIVEEEEKIRKVEEARKLKKQRAEERKKRLEEKKLQREQREKEKEEAMRLKLLEQEKREREREEQERIERERHEKEEEENLRAKYELKEKKREEKRLLKERREEEKRIRDAERKRLEQENKKKEEAERKLREKQEKEEKENRELQRKQREKEIREREEIARKKREEILQKKTEQIRQKVEAEKLAHQEEKEKAEALRAKPVLNTTVTVETSSALNSTYVKETSSYDMTPRGPNRILIPSTSENYNIDDLSCDDSTDDEDQPRKVIPPWAKGPSLQRALLQQYYKPPQINTIFPNLLKAVDLSFIFERNKPRYYKRTSSEHWSSPIMPPGNRSFTSHQSGTK